MKSIETIKENVRNQIHINEFDGEEKTRAQAIATIIAEVLFADDNADINISGIPYKAEWVKETYRIINHDDVKAIIEKIDKIRKEIRNPKNYLRTAIYNAVNEREIRNAVVRQGTFDPEEAFKIALARTYEKN